MKQQITVEYDSPVKVVTGMILWAIEPAERKTFTTECPVCNGSHSLTVNGHTFACPQCALLARNTVFTHYVVRKYRVCGIDVFTPNDYWKDADLPPNVVLTLFRKYGRGTHECREYKIRPVDIDAVRFDPSVAQRFAFSSYSRACELARDLNEGENARLRDFNAQRGAEFVFDWKETNDKEEKARGSIA